MSTTAGRSLELYYVDGHPDGLVTAELFNWTGSVLLAPRTRIKAALARKEASYTGVYLLIGELNGQPRAYVGEGDDIGARIRSHDANKDWWSSAILITTAANKLNKAFIRYLEARLIATARAVGATELDNGTSPPVPSLSEADQAKMEGFLEDLFVVLPALRVDLFIQRARPAGSARVAALAHVAPSNLPTGECVRSSETAPQAAPRFQLTLQNPPLHATAVLRDGEFIVEAGSTARSEWQGTGGHAPSCIALHDELRRSGVLVPEGQSLRFVRDYAFNSVSAAAAVIYGRPANGPTSWKVEGEEITYRQWEARQLATPPGDAA